MIRHHDFELDTRCSNARNKLCKMTPRERVLPNVVLLRLNNALSCIARVVKRFSKFFLKQMSVKRARFDRYRAIGAAAMVQTRFLGYEQNKPPPTKV